MIRMRLSTRHFDLVVVNCFPQVPIEGEAPDAAAAGAPAAAAASDGATDGIATGETAAGGKDLRQLLIAKEVERKGGRGDGWSSDEEFEEVPQDEG